jgi:hypothetical protein
MIILLFISLSLPSSGQSSFRVFDDFDIQARVNSDGILFMDPGSARPAFEFPKGSGKHVLFSSGLWIGGFDQAGALHMAAQTYRYGESDFWCGPLNANSGIPFSPLLWDDLWQVSRSSVDYHKQNYNQNGYNIPSEILEWPGSSYQGIQQIIAPFADTDHNGQYNPPAGDYPVIQGEDAVYFVFNDLYSNHTQTSGLPLGIEVYAMAFQVFPDVQALRNTVFVRYRIRNRSSYNYSNLRIGIFADLDIGNAFDDHYGTKVDRNLLYAENGDSLDGSGGAGEYGIFSPSAGVMLLSHRAEHSMAWYNHSLGNGNPSNLVANEYYRLMDGKWRDGVPLSFGGNGYQTGGVTTNFIYCGESDPAHPGQNWFCDSAADYRGLISTGPLMLSSGGHLTFDVAYTVAQGLPGQSTAQLFNYADIIHGYYASSLSLGEEEVGFSEDGLRLFPNPAQNSIQLLFNGNVSREGRVCIIDPGGKVILEYEMKNLGERIDLSTLSPGIYVLMYTDLQSENVYRMRFVKN